MNASVVAPLTFVSGSGWAERPSALESAVAGDIDCEFAVVGGGLGGMVAAMRLAELGHDVVLVEADVCGWGASGRNAGYVTPTVGHDYRVPKRFYGDRLKGLYRNANNAVAFTEELISSHGIECSYERTGNIGTAPTTRAFKHMQRTLKVGRRAVIGDARELGIPGRFIGGVHVKVGGTLNPAHLSLGIRERVISSNVRVFELSPVRDVIDTGTGVRVMVEGGDIRADRALLMNNAFLNELNITPRHLSTPVWTTAVETEPVSPDQLDAAGWTSRTPITTNHLIMQSFRTTAHGTIVFTSRALESGQRPRMDKMPKQQIVDELVRGFRERIPELREVDAARAWGGWIAVTPSTFAVVGEVSPRIAYSMACNGHGLPQAPYAGSLLADYIAGRGMHEDLAPIWRHKQRFAPGIVGPTSLRLAYTVDRIRDRLDF